MNKQQRLQKKRERKASKKKKRNSSAKKSSKINNAQINHLLSFGGLRLCVDCGNPTGSWCDGCESDGVTDYPPYPNRPFCGKCEDKNKVCKYCRTQYGKSKIITNKFVNTPAFKILDESIINSGPTIDDAVALKRKGKFWEAQNIYIELNKKNPDNKDVLFSWAKVKMLIGEYEEAKSMFLKSSKLSEKLGLYNEVKICKQHIDNLNFDDKSNPKFIRYLKEVAGNLNLEIRAERKKILNGNITDEEVDIFYKNVEKISTPFLNTIEKVNKNKNHRFKKNSSGNKLENQKGEESIKQKEEEEINPHSIKNTTDYSRYFSQNSLHFFETAEFLYHSNLLETLDYSCILTPYSKTVENEIYEKFLKKLEAWSIFSGEKIFIGTKEIKDFNLITLGQIKSLLFNPNVREFINNNYNKESASFLLNSFKDITQNLAQIRNPNTHKSKTSKDVVESFRKILIDEEYLINIARLN